MEKKIEELKWIDGIFLTERPIIKGTPALGRVIVEHPEEEVIKKRRSLTIILSSSKDLFIVGDELYGRIVSAHPDEANYKIGDFVLVTASGVPVKFSGVICESVPVHSILHKL